MKHYLFYIILFSSFISFAQKYRTASDHISDCDGAVNILNPGAYEIEFTGKTGNYLDLEAYGSLSKHEEINSVWCSFIAPYSGVISFTGNCEGEIVETFVFKREGNDICGEILDGVAEIERKLIPKTSGEFGLTHKQDENHLYPITLEQGELINIYFNIKSFKKKKVLYLKFKYEALSIEAAEETLTKVTDMRNDVTGPNLNIKIRDAETGLPVAGKLNIDGLKKYAANYNGSDFYFNIVKSGKIQMKVDAEGYFFADRMEPVSSGDDHEVVIWLEPLGKGKRIEMEGIQFKPGTSDFMTSAEPKLRRLKDFLSLNKTIHIEIQGHVHANENSFAAMHVSSARAKKVYKYLIENGINKDRLEFKGYGNTMMIYPDPKFRYEEQANRRVEIKVI